jgi:hypothetical protein
MVRADPRERAGQRSSASVESDLRRAATSVEMAEYLQSVLGLRKVAYATCVRHPRIVVSWAAGREPSPEAATRLRALYHSVTMLEAAEGVPIAQAWLMGMNPLLADETPLDVIRDGRGDLAVRAAARFVAGD